MVLEFWATWCAPCVAAIPHLNELSRTFAKDKVVIIAISNESEDRIHRFLAKHPMSQWIGLDESKSTFHDFNVQSLPTTVVIAPSGDIARVTMPLALKPAEIQALLAGELPPQAATAVSSGSLPEQQPLFQVQVSLSAERDPSYSFDLRKGILVADAMPLRDALAIAHDISSTRIVGPAAILDQSIAIQAHLPVDVAPTLRQELAHALATSFGISTRRENRDMTVYYLRLAPEGPLAIQAAAPAEASHLSTDNGIIIATNWNIRALASGLEEVLGAPVVDETKLAGKYDWDLSYDASAPGNVEEALRKQLGVLLVKSSQLLEVLVVEKQPRP